MYFGASDNQMEPFQTMEDFKKVFVHNVLLMVDVAIPDIFLYISNFMVNQLDNHPSFSKFIAHSVGAGAIIPYFRSNCEGSFVENLRQIREMGIVGLHDKADEVAKFFENSARGKVLRYQLWPDAPLSIGYKQLVESSLLTMSNSSRSAALEVFREETRDLREELFEEIPPDDRGGIRRGDILLAASKIAQRHGEPIAAFNDVWSKIADADLSRKLLRILKWASYCYYYNQGRSFDVKPGLSRLDELDVEFARLLDHQDHGEAEPHAIVEQVRLPSIDGLLTVDPEHLFCVRNSAKGEEYFKAISEWQTNPSKDNAEGMSQRLKEYANAITDVYT